MGVGDPVDVAVGHALHLGEHAEGEGLLGKEGGGEFELAGHYVDGDYLGKFVEDLFEGVEHVVYFGVADLVEVLGAEGTFLDLVGVFGLDGRVATDD